MNPYLFKFEGKMLLKNYISLFFGLVFPILLASLIIPGVHANLPAEIADDVDKSIFLTMHVISPLSIFLLGLSSIFSKDLEEGVYDRLDLFSINHLSMAKYKFLVYFLFYLFCSLVYFTCVVNFFSIQITVASLLKHLAFVSFIALSCFFVTYAICLFTKKFTLAYSISMILYFGTMILSGMMGISVDNLPNFLKKFANILPTGHFSSMDYLKEIAPGGSLNYSFLQGLITLLLLSIVLFLFSIRINKRKNN